MRRHAKLLHRLAVVLIAFALVAGSLQLGATDEPVAYAASGRFSPYYSEDELPAFPNALEYPLGDNLSVNGLPMRLSHFSTRTSAVEVRDFYLQEFEARGVSTKVVKTADGGFSLSGMISGGSALAVVVISAAGEETEVFPAIYPFALSEDDIAETVPDEDVPFSNGAVGIMKIGDQGQGQVVTYQEPLLSMNAAVEHVKTQMVARGWSIRAAEAGRKLSQIELVRGAQTARINLTPYQSQPTGVSVVAEYGHTEEE